MSWVGEEGSWKGAYFMCAFAAAAAAAAVCLHTASPPPPPPLFPSMHNKFE